MEKRNLIKNIEDICESTRYFFCSKYFGKGIIGFWSGNKIGSVLHVNDYTFTIEEMLDYLRNSASRDQMFDYISYVEETEQMGHEPLIFKHWKANLMRHK